MSADSKEDKEIVEEQKKQTEEQHIPDSPVKNATFPNMQPFKLSDYSASTEASLQRYQDSYDKKRQDVMKYLSEQEAFQIDIIRNPDDFENEPIKDTKVFKYYQCTPLHWKKLQRIIAEYNDYLRKSQEIIMELQRINALPVDKRPPINISDELKQNYAASADTLREEMYRFGSQIFLHMSEEDYNSCDLRQMQLAVEACQNRTSITLPNLKTPSGNSSSLVASGTM